MMHTCKRLVVWTSITMLLVATAGVSAQWTTVGAGIEYRQFSISGPNEVFVTRMDRANTDAYIESTIAQGRLSGGTEIVRSQADRYDDAIGYWGQSWGTRNDVVVAINGSYFETRVPPLGVPYGGVVHSGWYAKRHDNLGGWSGFMWDLNRIPTMGLCITHYPFRQFVTYATSNTQEFVGINVPPDTNKLTIWTPQYDTNTGTDNTVSEVVVQLNRPFVIMPTPNSVSGVVREIRTNQGGAPLPFDHIVLSANGTAATTMLNNVNIGDTVKVSQEVKHYMLDCSTSRTDIDWTKSYAGISGNWVFLQDGTIQYGIDSTGDRHPRTAIGFNDFYVFYLVVDGRQQNYSIGMTIDELAEFFKYTLDATWACNQDGGGSSTMVVNGTVMNSPSDGSERAVANGMLMCNLAPKVQSTTFSTDQTVQTAVTANVRLGPGTNYGIITSVPADSEGTILAHSLAGIYAKGEYWWKVDFPTVTGWVAESLLGGGGGITQFIVESRSGGQNYANYSENGSWSDSTAKSTAVGCTPAIGSRWASIGTADRRGIFSFTPSNTGTYEVFTTNGNTDNSGDPLIHRVFHAGGSTDVGVCQNSSCAENAINTWYSLGQYTLNGGTTYTVELDARTAVGSAPSSNAARSDAIRWLAIGTGDAPSITQHPTNQTVPFGTDASFSVQASGAEPLSYQWKKDNVDVADGGPYSGATTPTLAVTGATFDEEGVYHCVVTNSYGTVPSNPATLTVLETVSDFDGDSDVDQSDFGYFQRCMGILDVEVTEPACAAADLDADGDVTTYDADLFLSCVSGPTVPAEAHCVDSSP